MIYISIAIIICGLFAALFLFYKFPVLKDLKTEKKLSISVIIPCRNEEKNLIELLLALKHQTYAIKEIICVNDQSEDDTEKIIKESGVTLVNALNRPENWNGKPWALQQGAEKASGDILLFLDADVKLERNALETLAAYYNKYGRFSVQPYHKVKKPYESLALFFNMIAVGGTGITFFKPITKGMFGPVFMTDKKTYFEQKGHEKVSGSVLEDFELGKYYKKNNVQYSLFLGNKNIAFRMYPEGIQSQWEGFTKNFASGAASAGFLITFALIFYISSLFSVPILFLRTLGYGNVFFTVFSIISYIIFSAHILYCAKKLGSFNIFFAILYPIPLLWFTLIFVNSLLRKFVFKKVKWKGRNIKV